MKRKIKYYITDVFAPERYFGNQLAVFLDYGQLSDEEMQQIAREINFSETTFITSPQKKNGGYDVRIFTPGAEIDFAGHPTLGTAYILRKYLEENDPQEVVLNLKAGQIPVQVRDDQLWMRQFTPDFGQRFNASMIAELLNISVEDIVKESPIEEISTGFPFTIVPLKDMDALQRASINMEEYSMFIEEAWGKGILVFCKEGYTGAQQIAARVFVPYLGVPEDPATGSANGCLAAYLVKHKTFGTEDIEVTVGQGYEIGRPSEIYLQAKKEKGIYRVNVGGKVVEVAEGYWM